MTEDSRPENGQPFTLSTQAKGGVFELQTEYSSIFPLASEMDKHEKNYPGATKIVFEMAMKEQTHRQDIENRNLLHSHQIEVQDKIIEKRGQMLGSVMIFVFITGAFVLIAIGKKAEGIGTIIGSLAILLGVLMKKK